MPRNAAKLHVAPAPRSSSKRSAPPPPSRQSKRARAGARPSYAEPTSDTDEASGARKTLGGGGDETASSNYEDDDEKVQSSESEPGSNASASEQDSHVNQAKIRGRKVKATGATVHAEDAEEKELWKAGAKLAPGTQVIIKKPKARDAGDTPYTDERIHPNTMLFLQDLAVNNNRQWLKLHDPDYRVALQDFTTFIQQVSEKIIEADETIPELPMKDVIYRIYRDIRFSKDPTPYKTYFSAAWSRTGRKGPYAHYYVQIQPNGGSFVGGGYWQPDAASLSKLRRNIDRKPHNIKTVLRNEGIRKTFLGGVKDDDRQAVKAFVGLSGNQSNALKRNPKDYGHDHRDIELLRLRNFTVGTRLGDEEIVGPRGLARVGEVIVAMVPFISYLNRVCMPDEETSGSGEEDGETTEGEAEQVAEESG